MEVVRKYWDYIEWHTYHEHILVPTIIELIDDLSDDLECFITLKYPLQSYSKTLTFFSEKIHDFVFPYRDCFERMYNVKIDCGKMHSSLIKLNFDDYPEYYAILDILNF